MIVRGDVAGARSLGQALQRAAVGTGAALGDLDAARRLTAGWTGDAGDAWQALSSRQAASGDALAAALAAAGRALTRFADDIAQAQATAAGAAALAESASLPVGRDGTVAPVPVPMGPYSSPEQAADARRAADRAEVRTELVGLVAAAREQEERAHRALLAALDGLSTRPVPPVAASPGVARPVPSIGWNDWLDTANGLVLGPRTAARQVDKLARARAASTQALADLLPAASGEDAARLRREWRAGLRRTREARSAAARLARTARTGLGPVGAAARALDWTPAQARIPYLSAAPVLRNLPVWNVVMFGVGVELDRRKGEISLTRAVVKNAASTGASVVVAGAVAGAVGNGLIAMGAGVVAVAALPVVVGVGVGLVVGAGVGFAVEQWGDDVADAAGDVWDKVF